MHGHIDLITALVLHRQKLALMPFQYAPHQPAKRPIPKST